MTSSAAPSSENSPTSSPSDESATPSSQRTRSTTVWASIPLIAWGVQVVGIMMSFGPSNGSSEPAQDYEDGLTRSVDHAVPQAISGVTLFLAMIGVLIAIYLATVDRAVGAAALSMVLAGISLSVSLAYLVITGAPDHVTLNDGRSLVNVLPTVVLLASAVTLDRHLSTPEVAK